MATIAVHPCKRDFDAIASVARGGAGEFCVSPSEAILQMREIIREQLWIGNAGDGRDLEALYDAEIRAVVDLAFEEPPAVLNRDAVYCRFPLVDGAGNEPPLISAAISATAELVRQRIRTLVCCSAGMSRSPAIVAAALAIVRDDTLDECLHELTSGGPHDVSPLLWMDVTKAYRGLTGSTHDAG